MIVRVSLPLEMVTSRLPLAMVSFSLPSLTVAVRFFQISMVWLPSSDVLVADDQFLVVEDLDGLVALVLLLEADFERIVVLDDAVEVLLGVEVDLLGVLLVLEPQFVERFGGALLCCCAT